MRIENGVRALLWTLLVSSLGIYLVGLSSNVNELNEWGNLRVEFVGEQRWIELRDEHRESCAEGVWRVHATCLPPTLMLGVLVFWLTKRRRLRAVEPFSFKTLSFALIPGIIVGVLFAVRWPTAFLAEGASSAAVALIGTSVLCMGFVRLIEAMEVDEDTSGQGVGTWREQDGGQ